MDLVGSNDEASMAKESADGGDQVVLSPPTKKPRFGDEINRVAEIVLVLSAMGTMRGGKSPTEVELELMSEARSKLAEMCQEFSPKQIVGRDAIGAVIEDLGLNGKLKDQRLGFRAPRLTISEKVSLGKRKMEEAKMYPAMSTGTGYTSHMSQQTGGTTSPGLSTLGSGTHTVRVIDRANSQSQSSGVVMGSSSFVSVGSNAHQWPSNEFKVSTSAPTVGSHYVRDTSGLAQSRVLSSAPQGPGTSANYWNTSTWSAQPQPQPSFTVSTVADNKVPIQSSVRASDQSFRPFMSQTPPGTFPGTNHPMQAMNSGQTSTFGNNHTEIAKIIHKVLHPRVQQNPSWNPPSREYMNKAMTCQICQATINDVETLLICDACEKGYHLKCLQANNLKGVPKSEWHCSRCVQLYSGKSFPIKYGRVMRSAYMQKMPATTAGLQLQPEKKVEMLDPKVNQPKSTMTTGFASGKINPSVSISHSETAGANTNSRAAVTTNIGSQGLKENFTSSSSPAPVLHSDAANAIATETPSSVMNNGLISTGDVSASTMDNISEVPVANWVLSSTTPSSTSSAHPSIGLGSQSSTVANTGVSSSQAAVTANESASNASLGTLGNAVSGISSGSVVAVSHSETANMIEDAVLSGAMNASSESQGPAGNGAGCSSSSESIIHLEARNAETTTDNSQEPSKNVNEKEVPITSQDLPMKSPDTNTCLSVRPSTVESEKELKMTAESPIPQEYSTCHIDKSVSEPPPVSYNSVSNPDHSLPENEMPHLQEAQQNAMEDKSVDSSKGRNQGHPSEDDEDKSATMNEAEVETS